MLGLLNLVLFMFGAALYAARHVQTNVSVETVSDSSHLSSGGRRLNCPVGPAAVAVNCFISSSRYTSKLFRIEKQQNYSIQHCQVSETALLWEGFLSSLICLLIIAKFRWKMSMEHWWDDTDSGSRSTGRKTCLSATLSTCDRTRVSAVTGRCLNSSGMVRPIWK
jgi:hypothetical protein